MAATMNGNDHARAGILRRCRGGAHKQAGADDGADAKRDQALRRQRAFQLVMFGSLEQRFKRFSSGKAHGLIQRVYQNPARALRTSGKLPNSTCILADHRLPALHANAF